MDAELLACLSNLIANIATAQSRVDVLEQAVQAHWRQVGNCNEDICGFCDASLTANQQEQADGAGWELIVHEPDCIVWTLLSEEVL